MKVSPLSSTPVRPSGSSNCPSATPTSGRRQIRSASVPSGRSASSNKADGVVVVDEDEPVRTHLHDARGVERHLAVLLAERRRLDLPSAKSTSGTFD